MQVLTHRFINQALDDGAAGVLCSRTRMSKRGSKLLRYALINAAWQTTLVNDTFKDYYDLKVSQGRRHYNALGHVAHKLVRVIHKMMTDNVAFNLA